MTSAQTPDAEPPINIHSIHNEYDLRQGVTRFIGDVTIVRGPMRVQADEGVVRSEGGRIVSIELTGNPARWEDRLEDGTDVNGEAQKISFDVAENVVILTGNAVVRHEKGQFSGQELLYDLDDERLTGRGSADDRAHVVIQADAMRRGTSQQPEPDADATQTGPGDADSQTADQGAVVEQTSETADGPEGAGDTADSGEAAGAGEGDAQPSVPEDAEQDVVEDADRADEPDSSEPATPVDPPEG